VVLPRSGRFFFKIQNMQIEVFTIPVFDSGQMVEEMNRFLRGHKVLEVKQELYQNQQTAYWCYSISYLNSQHVPKTNSTGRREKVDYKAVLTEGIFAIFSALRVHRKEIANAEAIPAYAVFTDAELAKIAKLEELNAANILTIKGIGQAKVEKYGKRILEMYHKQTADEKSGKSD
jgi:superfamily II DNA helicase RecQ